MGVAPEALQADLEAWLANVTTSEPTRAIWVADAHLCKPRLRERRLGPKKVTNLNLSDNRASLGRMSVR